jgi:CubicO group peptidase (beta-lactamase class C family)
MSEPPYAKTIAAIERGIAQRLHRGAQFYVSQDGKTLADRAVGEASPGRPMTADHIPLWLSAGKPLTAIAIAKLTESRRLELDDPVARHLPEFAARGKDAITVRHLLTHTSGIRWADFSVSQRWDEIIARICQTGIEPRWTVGATAGYHALTSWYILAEIVRRLDPAARPFETILREEIFKPLGMHETRFALSAEEYRQNESRIPILEPTVDTPERTMRLDLPNQCSLLVPGAGARGPIRELGRFYEMLLRNGDPILQPKTVETFTSRQRAGMLDLSFKQIVDWGLGFILNSSQYGEQTVPYGYGPLASPRTFGHGGSQSSTGFCDPQKRLVVAVVFNGMPGEELHQARMRETLTAIYQDCSA